MGEELVVIEFRTDLAGMDDMPDMNTPAGEKAAADMLIDGRQVEKNFPPGTKLVTVRQGDEMVIMIKSPTKIRSSEKLGFKLMMQNMLPGQLPKHMRKRTKISIYFEPLNRADTAM